ncbi:unnamed protein product [Mytilus edulis]|uniref:Uncharacterized protein n=1 Tax=Mytilus edulis TaxID=6550 RepID=A0A8S3TWM5_MYTED|nr:unnamed protein product [Mytilus edulis]
MRNLQSKIADIDQGSNQYQADVQKVIQAIREEGRHLKEMIDKKVEGLINTLKEKDTRNVQTLQSVGNELKTALDKAKEQQKFYQDTQVTNRSNRRNTDSYYAISQICQKDSSRGRNRKLFGELTFGETVKKEENPKPKENVRVTRTAKQYRYRCERCG